MEIAPIRSFLTADLEGRSMEELKIVPAIDEEREWIACLLAGSEPWITLGISLERCREACRDPEYLVYVAHWLGVRCGAMVLHRRGVAGSPYLKSIAVAEGYRSRRIGTEMLRFAEDLFRDQARHMFLCVSSFNPLARAFYERNGYRAVGELKDYIIDGASETLMHRRLR
jgi:ribosomal-protein-alanine N-acetyltransferase